MTRRCLIVFYRIVLIVDRFSLSLLFLLKKKLIRKKEGVRETFKWSGVVSE